MVKANATHIFSAKISCIKFYIHSLFACWVIVHAFFVICCLFYFLKSKSTFSKDSFRNTICVKQFEPVSNSLNPDQSRHIVRPDLGPYCLQSLSADDTSILTTALFFSFHLMAIVCVMANLLLN